MNSVRQYDLRFDCIREYRHVQKIVPAHPGSAIFCIVSVGPTVIPFGDPMPEYPDARPRGIPKPRHGEQRMITEPQPAGGAYPFPRAIIRGVGPVILLFCLPLLLRGQVAGEFEVPGVETAGIPEVGASEFGGETPETEPIDTLRAVDTGVTVDGGEVPVEGAGGSGEDYPMLRQEEYTFAGGPRYTLLGKLPYRETHLRPVPAIATATGVAGIIAAIHFYQQDAWWSNRRMDFHFSTDWGYAAQADKFGHMYAGYLASYVGYEMLIASGFRRETAGWLGPLLAVGFQTYIEIEDGFSPFGFDPTDQYANVFGPLYFSLRNYIGPLEYTAIKLSYWPNDDYLTGDHYGHEKIVIDDYNGQQIWFSVKVGEAIPDVIPWPDWLRLAVGYGAYNVDRWDADGALQVPGRRFFIALDYDLVEMVPDVGSFGNWLVQTLDNFRWPAPALQIAPEVIFYLAWPVRF